ncbi:MAG: hypothetical protein N3E44_06775, partial [Candidatus Bathyarchaeota archaeon]|nr:hypothetical protein [Candidatus Bathyarchaeota archaeon]
MSRFVAHLIYRIVLAVALIAIIILVIVVVIAYLRGYIIPPIYRGYGVRHPIHHNFGIDMRPAGFEPATGGLEGPHP